MLEEQRLEKMGLLVRAKSYASATYANVGISDPSDLSANSFLCVLQQRLKWRRLLSNTLSTWERRQA